MKGLLIKDFLNLKKYSRSVLAILGFFILMSLFTKDSGYLTGMIVLMFSIMSITSFSYDDMAKWDMYALCLPVARKQIVKSKYILALILAFAGAALSMVLNGIVTAVEHDDFTEKLLITYIVFALAIAYNSILLPLLYKFGVEKSRFFMIAIFAVPTAAFLVMNQLGIPLPDKGTLTLLLSMSPAALVAMYAASYAISCRVYSQKEM